MISHALSRVGILHAEHYIICGSAYAGISAPRDFIGRFSQTTKANEFYDSKFKSIGEVKCDGVVLTDLGREFPGEKKNYNVRDLPYFTDILKYSTKKAESFALNIIKRYRTIEGAITAHPSEIERLADKNTACFLKLLGYLTARRCEDKFLVGTRYNDAQIAEFLKAKFLGQSSEQVYLLSFDEKGALLKVDFVCEGTVNVADVLPRRILEFAVMCGAVSVALAHNHPFGMPTPSSDDISLTASLSAVLMSAEIKLKSHFVVAGQLCNVIDAENGYV